MSIAASRPMIYRKVTWKLSEQLTGIKGGGGGGKLQTNGLQLDLRELRTTENETISGFEELSLAAF